MLDSIPKDIKQRIGFYLSDKDLLRASLLSTKWHSALESDLAIRKAGTTPWLREYMFMNIQQSNLLQVSLIIKRYQY